MVIVFVLLSFVFVFHMKKIWFDSGSKEEFLFTSVDSVLLIG